MADEQKNNSEVTPGRTDNKLASAWSRYRKLLTGLAIVLLLGAGGWVAYDTFLRDEKPKARQGMVCTDEALRGNLESRRAALDRRAPQRAEELKKTTEDIMKLSEFETDSQCLLFVVSYYLAISDSVNGRTYFDMLEKVHDGSDFVGAYNKKISVDSLKKELEFLEKIRDERNENAQLLGVPIEAEEGNE